MIRLLPAVITTCALLASGCASEMLPETVTIELGTGETEFEPLEDMQELTLVAGLQGGYHFIANARIHGLDPGTASMPGLESNPVTEFIVLREDGTRIDEAGPSHLLGYKAAASPWFELPSGRILAIDQQLVEEEGVVPAIYGERLLLRVEVIDADGIEASDEAWIVTRR